MDINVYRLLVVRVCFFLLDCSFIYFFFVMDILFSLDNYIKKLVDYMSRLIERLFLKGVGFWIVFLLYNYELIEYLRFG